MKALVINLDPETDRLAFQQQQAKRVGLVLERLCAVTVATIDPPLESPQWRKWQRPLRAVEIAAFLSHRAAWRRVLELNEPVLVLEDDAWLMPDTAAFLAQAIRLEDVEHLSLETRGRKKLLGITHPQMPSVRRLWLDRTGAAAYLLWPKGAEKLLARAAAVPGLADAVPVEARGLIRWQAAPAMAIQLDMATHYGLTPPIRVSSTISSVARPDPGGPRFRLRRIFRQIAMGISNLRPGTERTELRPLSSSETSEGTGVRDHQRGR